MPSTLLLEYGPWLETVVFLAAGAAVMVGSAAVLARAARSAVWQRTIVQAFGCISLKLQIELPVVAP